VVEQLLPLSAAHLQADKDQHGWDYIYEPDAQRVIDDLLVRYVKRWSTRPSLKTWLRSSQPAWWP
jgi:F0F1-type ATP synthase gamma subunit